MTIKLTQTKLPGIFHWSLTGDILEKNATDLKKIIANFSIYALDQGCPTRYTSGATCVAPEKGKEPLV